MEDGYAVTPGVYSEKKGLLRIGDDLLVGVKRAEVKSAVLLRLR